MTENQRIGLFGGSFDPVHSGHIMLANEAYKQLKLSKVIFIPAKQPPHKLEKRLTNIRKRLEMLQIALKPFSYFEINNFEVLRKETTYTIQTVKFFKTKYPDAEIFFIIGTDSILQLKTWKNIDELITLCKFVAGKRKGIAVDKDIPFIKNIKFLKQSFPDISSTEIRNMIIAGNSIDNLVPCDIEKYIKENQLYKHYDYK